MKTRNIFMYALGALIAIGFFMVVIYFTYVSYGTEQTEATRQQISPTLNLIIGALLTAFGAVVNYFFGSSKGSADKNQLLKP